MVQLTFSLALNKLYVSSSLIFTGIAIRHSLAAITENAGCLTSHKM